MRNSLLLTLSLGINMIHGSCCASAMLSDNPVFDRERIHATMEIAAEWQLANEYRKGYMSKLEGDQIYLDWLYGPFINGLVACTQVTDDPLFAKNATHLGVLTKWGVLDTSAKANDHATPQSWIELYEMDNERNPGKIAATIQAIDAYMASSAGQSTNVEFRWKNFNKWSWADSLYMSPPAVARLATVTGDPKYREYLHRWWWIANEAYYSPEHHLYYRDQNFFDQKAANGQPVFWGRGNGWVIGGLVRVIQYLEKDDPMRPQYETLLRDMLTELKEIRRVDGLWGPNLLDPADPDQTDTSASGFFVYALAYALNEGMVPKTEFQPVLEKAWPALLAYVQPNGKVIGCQPVGDGPKAFDKDAAVPYGTGAFLLAASEVYKMNDL